MYPKWKNLSHLVQIYVKKIVLTCNKTIKFEIVDHKKAHFFSVVSRYMSSPQKQHWNGVK